MFDFVIYKIDKYLTEMKMLIFELYYGDIDDRYMVIHSGDENDIWLLE